MPTIIDSLVVELGWDTAGVEAGRRKVEDSFKRVKDSGKGTGDSLDKAAKQSTEYLSKLRNNVLALFAAFTAGRGLKEFIGDMTLGDASLGRFSKMVGQSAEEIAAWRGAGRQMGIGAGEIDNAITTLTSNFQQFALTGDSAMIPWLRSLGVNLADVTTGKMKPFNQILLEISKSVQGMDPAKATAILSNLGFGPGMIQILEKGPAAIQALIDKNRDLAKAQAADADAAAQRLQNWELFLSQAERVGILLITTLTPALNAVANALEACARWAGDNPDAAGAVFAALTAITLALSAALAVNLAGTALTAVAAGFGAMTGLAATLMLKLAVLVSTVLPGLADAFLAVGAAIEATPVGWIITGIAALAAIGYVLYKNWDAIGRWWKNLWSGMGSDAEQGADKAAHAAKRVSGGAKPPPAARGAQPATGGQAPGYGAKGGPTQAQDIKTLQGFGWTREQATGIVANIQAESTGRADATGDNGAAYGLAQWHADRQARFKAWTGHDIQTATRAEQLGFIDHELRTSEPRAGAALAGAKDEGSAARAIAQFYERPAKVDAQANARVDIAQGLSRALAAHVATNRAQTNSSNTDVRVGTQNIYTQATDAKALAKDIKPALQNEFSQQANYGPV